MECAFFDLMLKPFDFGRIGDTQILAAKKERKSLLLKIRFFNFVLICNFDRAIALSDGGGACFCSPEMRSIIALLACAQRAAQLAAELADRVVRIVEVQEEVELPLGDEAAHAVQPGVQRRHLSHTVHFCVRRSADRPEIIRNSL